MPSRPQLECDVYDLLDEANVMMLLPIPHQGQALNLVRRMRDCAAQAQAAGSAYEDSERLLKAAADNLEKKVQAQP